MSRLTPASASENQQQTKTWPIFQAIRWRPLANLAQKTQITTAIDIAMIYAGESARVYDTFRSSTNFIYFKFEYLIEISQVIIYFNYLRQYKNDILKPFGNKTIINLFKYIFSHRLFNIPVAFPFFIK